MMISPKTYASGCKGMSYAELRAVRDGLLADILEYERALGRAPEGELPSLPEGIVEMCPSPDVVYQMQLEYLGMLCELLSRQFNREFEQFDGSDEFE